MKPTTIKYLGKTLYYHSEYTYESNQAQAMIDSFRENGQAAACTHEGNMSYLYVEKKP